MSKFDEMNKKLTEEGIRKETGIRSRAKRRQFGQNQQLVERITVKDGEMIRRPTIIPRNRSKYSPNQEKEKETDGE